MLAGLTGDPAPDGQAWNEAARIAIEQIQKSLARLKLSGMKVELSDSQDSQGSPQPGVEGAQKLVNVDHVQVIIGDFYSSVTSAVATSVTIPNNVLIFTGGTNPALSKLNAGKPVALVWEPVAADDIRARFSPTSLRRNSAPRPRSTLPRATMATVQPSRPSSRMPGPRRRNDPEVRRLQSGLADPQYRSATGRGRQSRRLVIDFCQTFEKLTQPLTRTGKWNPAKSFGSDTLNDCAAHGSDNYPGMRATQANASSGASFPAFKALFEKEAKSGVNFQSFVADALDSPFVAFLSALEAKSADPIEIAKHVVSVTNDPGDKYTFEQLDDAIKAVTAGKRFISSARLAT